MFSFIVSEIPQYPIYLPTGFEKIERFFNIKHFHQSAAHYRQGSASSIPLWRPVSYGHTIYLRRCVLVRTSPSSSDLINWFGRKSWSGWQLGEFFGPGPGVNWWTRGPAVPRVAWATIYHLVFPLFQLQSISDCVSTAIDWCCTCKLRKVPTNGFS